VLLLPFRGALTSPMLLQFTRRLVCHGLLRRLVTTCYVVLPTALPPPSPFRVAAISDAGHA